MSKMAKDRLRDDPAFELTLWDHATYPSTFLHLSRRQHWVASSIYTLKHTGEDHFIEGDPLGQRQHFVECDLTVSMPLYRVSGG